MIEIKVEHGDYKPNFTLDMAKGGITFIHNDNTVKVFVEDGFIDIDPNPLSDIWDVNAFDKYYDEISRLIKKQLFKKENITRLSWCNDKTWYFDSDHRILFFIDDKGKLHYHTAKDDNSYNFMLEGAYDRFHINREIISDDYQLTSDDIEVIKNTDIDPKTFRELFIHKYKGQYKHRRMAMMLKHEFSYHYKFFFKCERCGKETYEWHKTIPGAMVDYFGPFYCEDCKEIAEKERQEEYNRRYNSDPEFRKEEDARKEIFKSLKITNIKMPSMISSKLFEGKPMAPPSDKIFYTRARLCRR